MTEVVLELPDSVFSLLQKDPAELSREIPIVAAVKWYELRLLSQGRAAEIAGLSRAEFILALGRYRVSPFQYGAEEVREELRDAD